MEELAAECLNCTFDRCIANGIVAAASVTRIADDRVPDVREMNSNLMSASGLYLDSKQSKILEALSAFVNRVSRPAGLPLEHSHSSSVVCSSSDSSFDLASFRLNATVNEGYIQLENIAFAKLVREPLMSEIVLRDNQQARCIFVETMNDTGAHCPGRFRQGIEVIDQSVGKRP